MNIIIIDMYLRDQRALEWLAAHQGADGVVRVYHDELADHLRCHRNTVAAILKRLAGGGHIEILRGSRKSIAYRLIEPIPDIQPGAIERRERSAG